MNLKMAGDERCQFVSILNGLLNSDNHIRTQAENAYDVIDLTKKLPLLLSCCATDAYSDEIRQMAAILLRRAITNDFDDFYPKLSPESQLQFKNEVLQLVQQDQNTSLRKKSCDIAAEVARNLLDEDGNNKWPQFLQFLFECTNSSLPDIKECGLLMFSTVPSIFGKQQGDYLTVIQQMLLRNLLDISHNEVQVAAAKATISFILECSGERSLLSHFSSLCAPLVQVVAHSIELQQDDQVLKNFIELAENAHDFIRPQLESVLDMCMKVILNHDIDDSWKQLAVETIVTLAEVAPGMIRKRGNKYINILVPQLLMMMTEIEDDDEWTVSDETEEDDNNSNAAMAETSLDRLACYLGGKTVFPLIAQHVNQMLNNQDWRYRYAALIAISAVGEGCHKQMQNVLSQIFDAILRYLHDPHQRVRYACCNALGQMATDFSPIFEKKFHQKFISNLLMMLDDQQCPRVQAHAGAALVNFCEECPKELLSQYLESITIRLEEILNRKFNQFLKDGNKLVLEQIVTTIASVADTAQEKFVPFYDRFMPYLKYILQNATSSDLRLLRGKVIECISLIGLAVGAEKFTNDAKEVMNVLIKTQLGEEILAADDPQLSYMISAWARICKILGKQFEQYLPLVMEPVMNTASLKPELFVLDAEDMAMIEGNKWQLVSLGEQRSFGIKTAGLNFEVCCVSHLVTVLEDKATACQLLVSYAKDLKEGFAGYTEQVVKLMVPMLRFYFHDGVRSSASESLSYLLECSKIKGEAYVQDMWVYICPELLNAIESEPENDVLCEHLNSFAKCIEVLGLPCLTADSMQKLLANLDKILQAHFERCEERLQKRKDEDYDEDLEEELEGQLEEDVFILSKVSDIMHSLFYVYRENFFPYFDKLLPYFSRLLEPNRPWPDHQWALCIFDDLIEFSQSNSFKYHEYFLEPMLKHITDTYPEVRQAAAYGCGLMGQFGGNLYANSCARAIPLLAEVIHQSDSRSLENIHATENAISAVTKIMQHNSSGLNTEDLLPHWLSWLPVTEDKEEAPFIYGYLCDLIERNHPIILGANNSNLPCLLAIFAEVFSKEVFKRTEPLYNRILFIVKQVQNNADLFNACLSQLNDEHAKKILEILENCP